MTEGRSRLRSVGGALLLQSVLTLVLSVALARLLGPGGRGTYGTVTLVALIAAALSTFGFDTGHAFSVGQDRDRAPAGLGSSLVVAALAAVVVAPLVATLGYTGALGPIDSRLLVLGAAAIPALVLAPLLQGVLAGLGKVSVGHWLSTAGVALTLTFVVIAGSLRPHSARTALAAFLAAQLANAVLLTLTVARYVGWTVADPRPMLRQAISFSLTSHVANVLHLLHLRIDVLLVNYYLQPQEVGYYALAIGLCEWIWLLPRAAAAIHLPAVAGATPLVAIQRTVALSRFTLVLSTCGAVLLALLGPWAIPVLYGRAFSAAVTPLLVLLPGVALGSIASVLSAHFTGSGRPHVPLINALLSLIANIGLNVALIPAIGVAGAAIASTVTYTLCSGINVFFLRWLDGLAPHQLLRLSRVEALGWLGRLRP